MVQVVVSHHDFNETYCSLYCHDYLENCSVEHRDATHVAFLGFYQKRKTNNEMKVFVIMMVIMMVKSEE